MRVAVGRRRGTVSSPSGVGDTGVGVKDLLKVEGRVLVNESLELCNLADLLEGQDLLLLVAVDS